MKTHTVTMERNATDGIAVSEEEIGKLAEAFEDVGLVDMEDARMFAFDEFVCEASEVMHHASPGATFTKTFDQKIRVTGVVA